MNQKKGRDSPPTLLSLCAFRALGRPDLHPLLPWLSVLPSSAFRRTWGNDTALRKAGKGVEKRLP